MNPAKKSMVGRRLALGLAALVLLASVSFVFVRSGPLAPARVTVVSAAEGPLELALFGIGTVEARRSYLIGPTTAGRVRSVAVDVGDTVKAGQVLAEMDPVDLDERAAALDASSSRARSVVAAAEAQQRDAAARRDLAAANARRYADLATQQFISPGALEARQQELASAEAALAAATATATAARQDGLKLAADRASLGQQRAHVRLLAPSDGLVVGRDAEPGSTVVAGQAVLRLIDPKSLWVKVRLDQGRSAGLAAGLPARVALRSAPGSPLPGKVARLEAVSDSVTEERVAQVAFHQVPADVSVGELAEVTLSLPTASPSLVVPNAAIKRLQGQTGVWILQDGKLQFAPVRVGQGSLDGRVQVLDGLRAGASVVVHSDKELGAGSRVQVVEALPGARP